MQSGTFRYLIPTRFSYFFIALVGLISFPIYFIAARRFGPQPKKMAVVWPQGVGRNVCVFVL
jgi:uncharacterized membrane protein (DUF485 family)